MKRVFVVEENSKEHQQAQNEVKMLQVVKAPHMFSVLAF